MKASTVFLVILGLSISGVGVIFTWLMWGSYQNASDQRTWPQVDAQILQSEVEKSQPNEFSPHEYSFKVLYGYVWEGERRTSDRLGYRRNPRYKNRGKLEGLVEEYPAGESVKIYVNPSDPSFTILKPDSKAAGYSIWFPLVFVFGGLGISVRAVLKAFQKKVEE